MNASTPRTAQGQCGGELRGPNGNFSFRIISTSTVVCVWRITVTPGRKVQLILKSLIMPTFSARLRVLDGSTCGGTMLSELPRDSSILQNGIVSNSNAMTVMYTGLSFETGLTNIDATFSEIITATGTRTTPSRTAPATKTVIKFTITFLVVVFIC
ncbi:unnamed protein product [Dicrocoelium dendriticum]|nr:unnamed protein product [Dicrocoelium dendriticum]